MLAVRNQAAVLAAVVASALVAAPAAAVDFALSPALFAQLTFGRSWDVGVGTDVRANVFDADWDAIRAGRAAKGWGPYGQFVVLFRDGAFLASLGVHGQLRAERSLDPEASPTATSGELGFVWRRMAGGTNGLGCLLGASWQSAPWDVAARATLVRSDSGWRPEGHLTLGVRPAVRPHPEERQLAVGRPQREGDAFALGDVYLSEAHQLSGLDRPDATRLAIGLGWADAARSEAASVPAFVALARDLATAGAPLSLVQRALVAAADEVRHAQGCAAVASQALRREVTSAVPAVLPATDNSREALLVRLAVESWRDGLVGEGAAVLRARVGARAPRGPAVRGLQARIAQEEARHADLAADVVAWAVAAGGRAVQEAVSAAAVAEAPKGVSALAIGVHAGRWRVAGLTGPTDAEAAHRVALRRGQVAALVA